MRTLFFLLCSTVLAFSPKNSFSQEKVKINANKQVSVDEVFKIIKSQTDYTFIYQKGLFNNSPKVKLKKGQILVSKLLEQSLSNGRLSYLVTKENTIIIKEKVSPKIEIQQRQISGTIFDQKGIPIPFATILIKGTNKGTSTDPNGNYKIAATAEDTLIFTSIGYTKQEIIVGTQTIINITLKEATKQLDEVVINAGYYNTTKKSATGNISQMTSKAIEKQPVNNPLAAMQGQLSGVNIRQVSGVPGGGFEIDIRGQNSINGVTDPLFIIDGVPFGSQSLELFSNSGQILGGNTSPLNGINPNDIESMEVLKDADATAIYGSRGANGVVLITTKKGKSGKTQFNTNFSSTIGQVANFLDLMSTEQYLEIRREGITNDGFGAFLENSSFDFFWPDVKLWDNSRYTDWQKELIGGTSYRHNTQVSVTGGNEQTKFLLSTAYQKETTVFPGDANYKKATIHSNINHRSSDNRFKLNLSTIYSNEKNSLPVTDFTRDAYSLAPNAPALFNNDGNINWENNTWENPLASLEEDYQAKINTLMINTVISYTLLPNLEIKSNLGFNTYALDSYSTRPNSARNPGYGLTPENSSIITNQSGRQSWIIEPQLNWRKNWNNIKLNVLIGSTFQNETTQQIVQRGKGFPNNNLIYNLAAAQTLEALQDADSEYNYQAVFGRLNLNLHGRYILNVTGRKDGSSRFGPGKQFGNFGAIGLAWIFSEEGIFSNSSMLSFGKLRGSYGITGSDNIGDYRFLDTYSVAGEDYDGITILEPTGVFNPLFAWEENKKLEIGLDLGFFKDRLQLNSSWYQNRSSNQLVGIPLAATTGFSELTGNFDATVQNTGFEVDLRSNNIQTKNFKWITTVNVTVPKNKLLKFDGLETSTFANRLVIGKPLTIVKLYHSLGVDPETGKYQFEDYNNDGGISSSGDKEWIEDLAPKFYGGLGNTFSYKNWSFDFFLQFKKQKAYNELRFGSNPGYLRNQPVRLLDRWQQPGDTNPIQMASAGWSGGQDTGGLQSDGSASVSDGSYVRLRNVSLTYNLPYFKDGIDINIYMQGQNLLTFTNYTGPDPEQPNNTRLPQLRQITLGVQLGF